MTSEPPSFAIVTPSLDQGPFLRETIESVLAQDWPHVEYLVMDGGSRDGTLDVLRSYGDRVAWTSAPDDGQADAVNRGLARLGGSVVAFLNADDTYRPGALRAAAEGLARNPAAPAVYGDADYVDGEGAVVAPYPVRDFDRELLGRECFVCQPAAFVRRDAWDRAGGLDARLHYALDYDLWARLSREADLARIPGSLATSRMHRENKSLGSRGPLYRESFRVARRHWGYVPMSWLGPYARHRVDGVDQFHEFSDTSRRSRALALALGVRHNPGALRRFWADWQADGCLHRFRDGWMAKAHRSEHEVPGDARILVVEGRHMAEVRRPLILTVRANEHRLGRVVARRRGPFRAELPVPGELRGQEAIVTITSAWTWRPGPPRDLRRLSCLLDTVQFSEPHAQGPMPNA